MCPHSLNAQTQARRQPEEAEQVTKNKSAYIAFGRLDGPSIDCRGFLPAPLSILYTLLTCQGVGTPDPGSWPWLGAYGGLNS